MPPDSTHVDEEGVLLDNVQLVAAGRFLEAEMRALLGGGRYPSRNVDQNLADLRAQVAACAKGADELAKMVDALRAAGRARLHAARAGQRRGGGAPRARRAEGRPLRVRDGQRREDRGDDHASTGAARRATIDFTGTSAQQPTNFNAPSAVCKAAVLYVFRTLVDDEIPMNAGCLKPLSIVIPEGSMLAPRYPAAVVAGNVETSQAITDALYGALGVLAASQGTMNNFTFGNDDLPVLRDDLRRRRRRARLRRRERRADAHDQLAADRPGGARVALPGAARVVRDPARQRRRRARIAAATAAMRRVRFLEPMTAVMLANHRRVAPFGVAGGAPGAVGRNWVERARRYAARNSARPPRSRWSPATCS